MCRVHICTWGWFRIHIIVVRALLCAIMSACCDDGLLCLITWRLSSSKMTQVTKTFDQLLHFMFLVLTPFIKTFKLKSRCDVVVFICWNNEVWSVRINIYISYSSAIIKVYTVCTTSSVSRASDWFIDWKITYKSLKIRKKEEKYYFFLFLSLFAGKLSVENCIKEKSNNFWSHHEEERSKPEFHSGWMFVVKQSFDWCSETEWDWNK